MDVSPIAAQEGVAKFNAIAEHARQLAITRQTTILQNQGVNVNAPAPEVVSNPTFSPALYAQAAQFQLYTQSGALTSLVQQTHGVTPSKSLIDEPEEIHAVEPTQGSNVDTLA